MIVVALTVATTVAALGGGYRWARRRYLLVAVQGASMSPALQDGDRVLVRRAALRRVRRGDVVVFAVTMSTVLAIDAPLPVGEGRAADLLPDNPQLMVKRAVAIPGDGIPGEVLGAYLNASQDAVPADKIVVVGDNLSASLDSRHYGYVTAEQVVGVMVRRVPL